MFYTLSHKILPSCSANRQVLVATYLNLKLKPNEEMAHSESNVFTMNIFSLPGDTYKNLFKTE